MNPELTQAPVSGRRRQDPSPRIPVRHWPAPKLIAAGVALVGVLLVVAGGLRATVYAPPPDTRATLVSPGVPVVSAAVGLIGLEGPRLEVDASAKTSGSPVFIGIGRAHDVDAYLAAASRLEMIGDDDDGKVLTKRIGSQPTLPDPAAADVWVVSARGLGAASLAWPKGPGQWRLVVAGDGTAAAATKITLIWSGREHHTPAPAFISIGLVLIVAGLITLVMLGARSRLEGES
jgi:hypothetical protein